MNTEKAIEKLKYWFGYYHDIVEGIHGEGTVEAMKQVEKALECGEKYKAIVNELKNRLLPENYIYVEAAIQKYFPKGGIMKTKGAIDWLKGFAKYADNGWDMPILSEDGDKAREIIELLERGERYRIMHRDILTNMKISKEEVERKYSQEEE